MYLLDCQAFAVVRPHFLTVRPLFIVFMNLCTKEQKEFLTNGYPAFIGQAKAPKWLESNWLLSLFGSSRRSASKNYRDFVEKINIANLENPAKDITGGFILGGDEFVNWVKESFLSNQREKKKSPSFGN